MRPDSGAEPGELAPRLRLMVTTDRRLAGARGWLDIVETTLQAGATAIQLRDKKAPSGQLLEMAGRLRPLCDRHAALFLVNDRLDVALAAGADGVHLGDDDLSVAEARRVAPVHFLIGRSADSEAAARAAEAEGASYLGVGSIFGTQTKEDVIGEAIGTDRLLQVVRAVSIPIVGIGGVRPENAAEVARAGAAGIAVVSALMTAPDPAKTTRSLLEAFAAGRG